MVNISGVLVFQRVISAEIRVVSETAKVQYCIAIGNTLM
jgi:hypothetical protein